MKKVKICDAIQDLELKFDEMGKALKAAANSEDYINLSKMGSLIRDMDSILSQIVILKTFI